MKMTAGSSAAPRASETGIASNPKGPAYFGTHQSERPNSSAVARDNESDDSHRDYQNRTSSSDAAGSHVSSDATGVGRGGDDARRETRDPDLGVRSDSPSAPQHPHAHVAGGNGGASTDSTPGNASAGIVRSDARNQQQSPPWQSSSWQNDRARAMESLDHGGVPDRYRDLVRDYFTR
jgi:hypothetical protein